MNNKGAFFYFSIIIIIPLSIVLCFATAKAIRVLGSERQEYIFLEGVLTENVARKYGDHATFTATYNGQVLEGSGRSLFWSQPGDTVKVYFRKNDPYDNGIVSQLVTLLAGQWLLWLFLASYLFYCLKPVRRRRGGRHHHK